MRTLEDRTREACAEFEDARIVKRGRRWWVLRGSEWDAACEIYVDRFQGIAVQGRVWSASFRGSSVPARGRVYRFGSQGVVYGVNRAIQAMGEQGALAYSPATASAYLIAAAEREEDERTANVLNLLASQALRLNREALRGYLKVAAPALAVDMGWAFEPQERVLRGLAAILRLRYLLLIEDSKDAERAKEAEDA